MRNQPTNQPTNMTPPQLNFIDGVLAFITERRDALTELETSIRKVQHLFGMPVTPGSVTTIEAPAPRQLTPATRTPGRPATARRATRASSDVESKISAFLDKQKRPTTFAAVVQAAGRGPGAVRKVLARMVAAKTLIQTGSRRSLVMGRPSVMSAENSEED